MTTPRKKTNFNSADARWQAVSHRDASADDRFVYSVKTTGVYCKPSCAARRARRENVEFHTTPKEAERAGFRACKRCRPNAESSDHTYVDAVAKACALIVDSADAPDLETLADAVGMSASHFHRMFKAHTGLTPKAYAIAHRSNRVREELTHRGSVTSAIYKAGFNSNGRFYATSKKVLGMKPATFRAGGAGATIRCAVGDCSLGKILVAASQLGICSIALGDDASKLVDELQERFPKAQFIGGDKNFESLVAKVITFVECPAIGLNLPLEIQGTAFQQRVWQKLCEIPCGETRSYSQIAQDLGEPKSTRAVASACAANNIAVAIPCHRVVKTDGKLSGYRWGIARKSKLLKIERADVKFG